MVSCLGISTRLAAVASAACVPRHSLLVQRLRSFFSRLARSSARLRQGCEFAAGVPEEFKLRKARSGHQGRAPVCLLRRRPRSFSSFLFISVRLPAKSEPALPSALEVRNLWTSSGAVCLASFAIAEPVSESSASMFPMYKHKIKSYGVLTAGGCPGGGQRLDT